MVWNFDITAASRPKVLMRIAQVFDQQQLSMTKLSYRDSGTAITLHAQVDTSGDHALRIQAKLYAQCDVKEAMLSPVTPEESAFADAPARLK